MTYGVFLLIFLGIPVAGMLALGAIRTRSMVVTLAVLSLVALIYTAPWDNLIVINGVWSYGERQVSGIVIGHVPLEEYVFYVLQVVLTGSITALLLRRKGWR